MSKAFEKFDLTGKVALITGAAGLLGIEHAAALLDCGATIVLTDIGERELSAAQNILSSKCSGWSNFYTRDGCF